MQSPWGRTRPGVLEEQQGGLRVWRTVSEGQEEGKEDTEGTEQVMQSLVGCGKKFKLVASFCDPVLSRVISTIVQKHQFFGVQLSL